MLNSRYPLFCDTHNKLPHHGPLLSRSYEGNLPSSFNIILSSAFVFSTHPPVSVSGTICFTLISNHPLKTDHWRSELLCYFLENLNLHGDLPISPHASSPSSHRTSSGILYQIPIDYAFQPRLRGRLTLRCRTLRRKPWIFGGKVFHFAFRYLCQHSHFLYLQEPSQVSLLRLKERSATTSSLKEEIRNFGVWLETRYIFGAQTLI